MSEWLILLGWPPSLVSGGILILLSLAYAMQARLKLRPLLLALQVGFICLIANTLIASIFGGNLTPLSLVNALLTQTFGFLLGHTIISWLIIKLCFIIRSRNDQSNIFTRNRS
jgi:hypothetical protein